MRYFEVRIWESFLTWINVPIAICCWDYEPRLSDQGRGFSQRLGPPSWWPFFFDGRGGLAFATNSVPQEKDGRVRDRGQHREVA